MDLFDQVSPKKRRKKVVKKEIKKKTKEEIKEESIDQIVQSDSSFNSLEETKPEKIKIKKIKEINQEIKFDSYKHNMFSLLINCNKFVSKKPYYYFSRNKDIFLFNNEFNDYFDIKGNSLLIDNLNYKILDNLKSPEILNILKEFKIKYINFYDKKININDSASLSSLSLLLKNKQDNPNCIICPFFNLKKQDCALNDL